MAPKKTARLNAVPALRSGARSLRTKQRIVIGLLGVMALCGPAALVITVTRDTETAPVTLPSWTRVSPAFESFATQAAQDFLAGKGTTLPVADTLDDGLGAAGAAGAMPYDELLLRSVGVSDYTNRRGDTLPEYRFSFAFRSTVSLLEQTDEGTTISDRDMRTDAYVISVTLRLERLDNGSFAPVIAALPTITPDLLAYGGQPDKVEPVLVPPGVAVSLTGDITAAVGNWAQAYVTGDAIRLKELVNVRGDANNRFEGLGGFAIPADRSVSIPYIVQRADGLLVAQVNIPLQRTGTSFVAQATYDVLIEPGSPAIVRAWGVAGSGADLEPFGNSLS